MSDVEPTSDALLDEWHPEEEPSEKRRCGASPLVVRDESPAPLNDDCDIASPAGISGQLNPVSGFKPSRGRQSDLLVCVWPPRAGNRPGRHSRRFYRNSYFRYDAM